MCEPLGWRGSDGWYDGPSRVLRHPGPYPSVATGSRKAWSVAHNADIPDGFGKNLIEQTTNRMFGTPPNDHTAGQVVVTSWCSLQELGQGSLQSQPKQ